jgi:hypothetical protein
MLLALIEQRRRLSETERRRHEALSTHLTTEQAVTFVAALQQAVVELVPDRTVRAAIGRRVEALLVGRVRAPAEPEVPVTEPPDAA